MAEKQQPETIQKGLQELEKEITCPFCHEHFQEPKILPCYHYYCKGCVQAIAWRAGANHPFACPECRSDTVLPQNDPNQLPTAFFVKRKIDLHAKMEKAHGKVEALCGGCAAEGKAIAFCHQCTEFICDNCVKSHQIMRAFSDHEVVTLEELKVSQVMKQMLMKVTFPPPKCKVHGEQVKMYCCDCRHLICHDCIIDDHAGHKYEFVKKVAPTIKHKLADRLVKLKSVRREMHDDKKVVESRKLDITSQGESAAIKIKQSFQKLRDFLEQHEQMLLGRTSCLVKEKLDQLSAQENGFDMSSSLIQSLIDFVERNIENATEEELMGICAQLFNRIDEERMKHQQNSENREPVEEADILVKIECAEEFRLCLKKSIVCSSPDPAKSTVQRKGLGTAEVNKTSKVYLHAVSSNGKPHKKPTTVKANLASIDNHSIVEAEVKQRENGIYEIEYTPCIRGRHQLEVTLNGLLVAGSPFPVFAKINPSQLGKPMLIYPGLTVQGIAFNSKNEMVYIEDDGDVVMLDRSGRHLNTIKKSQYGFQTLTGIAIDNEDNIYVTDSGSGSVIKFDSKCVKVKTWCDMQRFSPKGIAASTDRVIVSDKINRQLLTFSRDLEYKSRIESDKVGPVGIACDADGLCFVCDYDCNCVRVLSTSGEVLYSFSTKYKHVRLSQPQAICVDTEFVYVSEWGLNKHCISVFTKKGVFVSSFGETGNEAGQFDLPCAIATDSDGALYVGDFGNYRIQVF